MGSLTGRTAFRYERLEASRRLKPKSKKERKPASSMEMETETGNRAKRSVDADVRSLSKLVSLRG